jgi:hypothetical protein
MMLFSLTQITLISRIAADFFLLDCAAIRSARRSFGEKTNQRKSAKSA